MSIMESRGGWPHVYRIDGLSNSEPTNHRFGSVAKYLKIRAADNDVMVFFTEEDATAGENYVLVPVPSETSFIDGWEGPAECREVWLQSAGTESATSDVELVAFLRRG